jgi:hypothetical protein
VQQLLLHLLAVAPRPHWLSIHVRSSCHAARPTLCWDTQWLPCSQVLKYANADAA